MFEGGSLAFFEKLFKPEIICGMDIRKDAIIPLEEYEKDKDYIHTFYNLSQDNKELPSKFQSLFPEGIDMIIDDASHHYELSRETFKLLFPLVSTGGIYIIEDWAWSHRPFQQTMDAPWKNRPALTNLIFELVVLSSTHPAIESIEVFRNHCVIKKNDAKFSYEDFDYANLLRGKELSSI